MREGATLRASGFGIGACGALLYASTAIAGAQGDWRAGEGGQLTREFREKGVITRSETDLNSDGRPDTYTEYKAGVRWRGQEDRDLDGAYERTLFYNAKGGLMRDLTDSNADGKPDRFYLFPHGNRGAVLRETDRNFDGKIDSRNFALWDDARVNMIPDGKRMMRVPMPGYRTAWEERDDDHDGVIDFYRDSEDKQKTRVGQKMHPLPQEAPAETEVSAPPAEDPNDARTRVDKLNERYGL